jgi:predicted regulator of Ras-like GTPase activity (Roadblock/LC7/MglB family)
MLQRILARFTALTGVDQAYIISIRDGLVSAVGKRNRVPEVEHATQLLKTLIGMEESTGIGKGLEMWCEGGEKLMLSRLNIDSFLVLSGKKGGRIARWRHAIECDVDMICALIR